MNRSKIKYLYILMGAAGDVVAIFLLIVLIVFIMTMYYFYEKYKKECGSDISGIPICIIKHIWDGI